MEENMRKIKNDKLRALNAFLLILEFLLLIISYSLNAGSTMVNNVLIIIFLFSVLLMWFYHLLHNRNIIMLLFLPSTFLFLMGRPLVSVLFNDEWQYYGQNITFIYLCILYITIITIYFSSFFDNHVISSKISNVMNKKIKLYPNNIIFKQALRVLYFIVFTFYCIEQFAYLIRMQGMNYEDFYLGVSTGLPWIVAFISGLYSYVLCFVAAYEREVKYIMLICLSFIFSSIPMLIIGQRNPVILAVLFSICIIFLKNKLLWHITFSAKKIKVIAISGMVMFITAVAALSFSSRNVDQKYNPVVNLVYNQGFTYETICIGIDKKQELKSMPNNNFTFAQIIDYYKYGKIGNIFFDTEPIPEGNNVDRVNLSNDLAHKLSYVANPTAYLFGGGYGSSYVLELYLDYGFVGVIVGNICICLFCILCNCIFGSNFCLDIISVYILQKLFLLGRNSMISPIAGLFTIHFALVCVLIALLYIFSCKISNVKYGDLNYDKNK